MKGLKATVFIFAACASAHASFKFRSSQLCPPARSTHAHAAVRGHTRTHARTPTPDRAHGHGGWAGGQREVGVGVEVRVDHLRGRWGA